MHKDSVRPALSSLAFDFFFWFSRFEFALKENGYLRSQTPGDAAEPGWDAFVAQWKDGFVLSEEAAYLLANPPDRQIVGPGGGLDWKPVGLGDCTSDLAKVARLLKTARNNLFHGGKHGSAYWDSPKRTAALLKAGEGVLHQLSALAGFEGDYLRIY